MASRIEFTKKVRSVIAGRACYRCAFPGCDRATMGPGVGDEPDCVGQAAHIYSAAPGGPRGQGNLDDRDLASHSNGIWLCATHAQFVDQHRGERFSPADLMTFRELHECRILAEMVGLRLPVYWFRELRLRYCHTFKPQQTWSLGKVNVLVGPTASGKTKLCNLLLGAVDSTSLSKWGTDALDYSLTICDPSEHRVRVVFQSGQCVYYVDDIPVPINPVPVQVTWHEQAPVLKGQDDIGYLSAALGETRASALRLVGAVARDPNALSRVHDVRNTPEEEQVLVTLREECTPTAVTKLSHGERKLFMLDMMVAKATIRAVHLASLLVADDVLHGLDARNAVRALRRLMEPSVPFQTIITAVDEGPFRGLMQCQASRLRPTEAGTVIEVIDTIE